MMPGNVLSTAPQIGYYLEPDDLDPSKVLDYELGGVALNDASLGLQFQVWKLEIKNILGTNNYGIYLSAPNTPETLQFTGPNITEACLAFDQNMRPFVAFVENGQAKFWWWDSLISQAVFTTLPVGTGSPKCCLDDKRLLQSNTSDIILTYVRSGSLYFRMQRDRYTVEYTLISGGVTSQVIRVGMNNVNRLQFALGDEEIPSTTVNPRVDVTGNRRSTVSGDVRRVVGLSYG